MQKLLMSVITLLLVSLLLACGKDDAPLLPLNDGDGFVFLENGTTKKMMTRFNEKTLRDSLTCHGWTLNYAFYYDKNKAGTRSEAHYMQRSFYVFHTDGTVNVGTTNYPYSQSTVHPFSINGKAVNVGDKMTFYVVGIDSAVLVVDEPIPGEIVGDYDPATLHRRLVMKPYHPL